MTRTAVLLRGVNVGRNNRVSMADFRTLLESLGCTGVRTYLQSGNAVVDADRPPEALAASVAAGLDGKLGLSVRVMARTGEELANVVEANPYAQESFDPALLHVAFLSGTPAPALLAAVDAQALLPDRLAVGDRVLYLRYETGSQNSPLAKLQLGVDATARNWRTVTALRELAA